MIQKVLCCLFIPTGLWAQTFDVASLKRVTDPALLKQIKTGVITREHGNLYMRGITMGWIIRWAYNLQTYQLIGPDWIAWNAANTQPRYDLVAKSDDVPEATTRTMLQALLTERVGLKFHTEDREKDVYILQYFPGRLEFATEDGPQSIHFANNVVTIRNTTVRELCDDLSQTFQVPLVDRTDLGDKRINGNFRVLSPARDEILTSILTGLKKDLGLVMSRSKVPIKMFVVDSINQEPTEN